MAWVLIAFLHAHPVVMLGPYHSEAECRRSLAILHRSAQLKREFPDATFRCSLGDFEDGPKEQT